MTLLTPRHCVPSMLLAPLVFRLSAPPAKRRLLLLWAVLLALSVSVVPVIASAPLATSAPPLKATPPWLASSVRSRPAVSALSLALSAVAALLLVRTLRSRWADTLLRSSMVPAALSVKSPLLAAASPRMRTPTPLSLAMSWILLAYMPPSAAVSMA